jgi:DNA-binding NarL/FixJ family response regulator
LTERRFVLEDVLGREFELELIRDFLDTQRRGFALFLEGPAGIGKTTLWQAGVALAQERNYRVLACRPAAAETAFSFAAIRDLLSSAGHVGSELPPPQRHALEVALGLADGDVAAVSEGLIGAAAVSLLERLAEQNPVLLAVDDQQWLDAPSASVLRFAIRRLFGERVKLLIATRTGTEPKLLELQREFSEDFVSLEVGPLSFGALHRFVVSRLGAPLPRPSLRRVEDISRGNPFYALELARSLLGGTTVRVGDPLAIPETLDDLVTTRLDRLPDAVTELLEIAALLAEPTRRAISVAISDPESTDASLKAAVASGLIELEGQRIYFTHPLLAAGVTSAIPPRRSRQLHRQLAQIVVEPEERARHLAAASDHADVDVANALDEAGRRATRRGAPAAAAELMELAAKHTPAGDRQARWRRLNEAGLRFATAGELRRAQELLEPLVDEIPVGPLRAHVLLNLADFRWDDHEAAVQLAERALREVGSDDACRARIHMLLSSQFVEAGHGPALAHIRAAHDAAIRSDDEPLALLALVNRVHVEVCVGELTDGLLDDALTRVSASAEQMRIPQFESPHLILGLAFLGLGRFDEARAAFERALVHADDQGVAFAAACAHAGLAEVASRLGDWDTADWNGAECVEHYEQLGTEDPPPDALYVVALTHAQRGHVDEARSLAERGVAVAAREGQDLWGAGNRSVLGFLELSRANAAAALQYLQPPDPSTATELWHFPIYHDLLVNTVEALVGAGELVAADSLLGALDERARRMDNPWERGTRARCRGLVCASRGDFDAAFEAFEAALREQDQLHAPLDRARTLLALGRLQRRLNRKRLARSSLEAALGLFDELGARLWGELARKELGRIGGRAATRTALTPTELHVAELVAQGLSNKEIAAELVVTVKAVEATLTRIYGRFGIRSRTELARLLRQLDSDATASAIK